MSLLSSLCAQMHSHAGTLFAAEETQHSTAYMFFFFLLDFLENSVGQDPRCINHFWRYLKIQNLQFPNQECCKVFFFKTQIFYIKVDLHFRVLSHNKDLPCKTEIQHAIHWLYFTIILPEHHK